MITSHEKARSIFDLNANSRINRLRGRSVLIADGERMLRELLRSFLESRGMSVIGEASSGQEAVSLSAANRPDIVLLDVCLPILNGIDAAREIHGTYAEIGIIVSASHLDRGRVVAALRAGALGLVWKGANLQELETALTQVATGHPFISPAALEVNGYDSFSTPSPLPLTQRQRQVLQLIAEEKTNKEIATILDVSSKTVEKHRTALMARLDVHSVAGLVRLAVKIGLIE